jgi:hypothetical protein
VAEALAVVASEAADREACLGVALELLGSFRGAGADALRPGACIAMQRLRCDACCGARCLLRAMPDRPVKELKQTRKNSNSA